MVSWWSRIPISPSPSTGARAPREAAAGDCSTRPRWPQVQHARLQDGRVRQASSGSAAPRTPPQCPSLALRKGARTGPARGRQYLVAARWTAEGALTEGTRTATAPHGRPRRAGKCACATLGLQNPESPSLLLEFRDNYQPSRLSKNLIVLEILHLESTAVSLTSSRYLKTFPPGHFCGAKESHPENRKVTYNLKPQKLAELVNVQAFV